MNRRNIYTVPDLTTKDIVAYLADIGISVSPADILKPSPAITSAVYDSLLEVFEGRGIPDVDESLQVVKQVQRMGNLLNKIGIQNFTIRDLNPDSRRLVQILSALINFGMYRDNKKTIYEQASRLADENCAAKKRLEREFVETKESIEKTHEELALNFKIKENLESEVQSLENELKEFYKYQKEKMDDVSRLKSEKIEIGDKLCSCQLLEHNLKQEITCLKTQIVSDPTKLLELVEEMRILIEKERDAIRNTEKAVQEQQDALSDQEKTKSLIDQLHTSIIQLRDIDEKIEKFEQCTLISESKQKNWDTNINALKIRINHLERQISHLESKIFNLQSKDKKASEEVSGKIAGLQSKYDAVNTEREQLMEKVKGNNKLVQEVSFERARKSGEYERECAEIAGMLVNLNGEIDVFFNELKNLIN